MPSPPSGVVTFLFTDVEGSTRRWEMDADGMRAALVAHDKILRGAIEDHGGFMFKHTGDGVCAAFASPKSAVDAAIAAQRKLELPVRMGIATGEADVREGDYFGAVLNRAARVMAAGHGGQVLVADSTVTLLSGCDLMDLGPQRLRDLPTPIGLCQVLAPGLRADFPALRALESGPGNLRPAVTSFIGRDAELVEVAEALHEHRLVTLTGVGGVGKTRLAVEVAGRLSHEFPHGVWVFELAAVSDPAAVPDAVAAVLAVTQQPGKSMTESIAAALEDRVRLLVFDNCEHLLDAAGDLIQAILMHSTTVTILATSREGLGIADEQLWPVPSLDVGAGIGSAAVDLFVERARNVAPRFSARADAVAAVVEICRRLDGIPLAIELAASRLASMTAIEVRGRLDQRFRLLVGSRRGLTRHQTLRHAVQWSYDLLDEAEKALLERCSVFAGGFDLQSACAIAGFDGSDDFGVLDLLDALVRKSLLVADHSSERTRFSMLETIRQFAEDQLVARGAATEARNAHARHFAQLEAEILALWDSPSQREVYTWFSTELPNLRTAFRWAVDCHDLDTASTIAVYVGFIGVLIENYEPASWAEELIEPARAVDHRLLAALYVMASQCYTTGRIDEAVALCDAGQAVISRKPAALPYAMESMLGGPYTYQGRPDRWLETCRTQLDQRRGNPLTVRACLVFALVMIGAVEQAVDATTGLIEAAEATKNPFVVSFVLTAYGFAYRDIDPVRALDPLRRGLMIAQDSGNRFNETQLALALSRLEAMHGDPVVAFDHIALAIRNMHDSGNSSTMSSPLAILAALFDRLGRYEPAATIAGSALTTLTALAFPEISTAIAHLRNVLGDQTYESLAHKGQTMTTATMAAYAYDQIDQAKTELT